MCMYMYVHMCVCVWVRVGVTCVFVCDSVTVDAVCEVCVSLVYAGGSG